MAPLTRLAMFDICPSLTNWVSSDRSNSPRQPNLMHEQKRLSDYPSGGCSLHSQLLKKGKSKTSSWWKTK